MTADTRPCCTLIGGANGSGKSSLYDFLKLRGEFVNADAVAKLIDPAQPESVSFAAGKKVLQRLDELIRLKQDFVYETTLSGNQPLQLIRVAKKNGYRVDLVFVVLASVELNVERVAQRVALGGHDIPEPIIRRRFASSLSRLAEAIRLADDTAIFDNTTRNLVILAKFVGGLPLDNQLNDNLPSHRQLAEALANIFGQ